MKHIRLTAALFLCAAALTVSALAAEPPEVSAAAWALMDAGSGRVLAGQSEDEPRLIASTTKIMTALLALERCDPDEAVVIDPAWTGVEGSTMYLEAGQVMTVRDLLYGLMLASGNDAAEALACITAGDAESFAALMNERAAALGCENTHFENPSGLDGEDHHSSARDLALIAREAIQNEDFRAIVSTRSAAVGDLVFTNHNRLLGECEGVFGVKTGYTEAAGRTLVTCCEREGITLICVTLSDPDDWADHTALYDWAFDAYAMDDVLAGRVWTVPVIGGCADETDVVAGAPALLLHSGDERVTVAAELPAFAYAQISAGEKAGSASVYVDGEKTVTVPLLYAGDVPRDAAPRPGIWERLRLLLGLSERKIYTFS